jgi:hypothetical protein
MQNSIFLTFSFDARNRVASTTALTGTIDPRAMEQALNATIHVLKLINGRRSSTLRVREYELDWSIVRAIMV